jgi:hypothetical protein
MPAAAWLSFNRRKHDGAGRKPYPVFILESRALADGCRCDTR